MKSTIPTKPGFYWAKSGRSQWFNLIVEVHGESPFFRLRAWNRMHDTLKEIRSDEIEEWGPMIDQPN